MQDRLKPTEIGVLSGKVLKEVDCDIPRKYRSLSFVFYNQQVLKEVDCDIPRKYRSLSFVFYNQPMGNGDGDGDGDPRQHHLVSGNTQCQILWASS